MTKIKNKKYLKALSMSIIMSLQFNTFAFAADTIAVPDASEGKAPIVESSANGTVVVDIRTPNAAGLSHNQFQNLQVGEKGIIFNNSREITQTQLAGYITGNPNIGRSGADVILNEVTGRNITNLNGFIEVAGKQSDVIIANPNGIIGNNFGYINTGRAVLTTGNPEIDSSGHLAGFTVNRGDISIEGRGLDASQASRMDIFAEAVKINSKIAAQKLKVVGGRNKLDADGNVVKVTDDEYTGVALDVGAVGSMYANSIYMVGTTKGLGVNMEGEASASGGDFVLTSDGSIKLKSKLSSTGDLNIHAENEIENTGTIYGQNIQIKAGTLSNNGGEEAPVIAARENLSIEGGVVNNTDALLLGAENVTIKANELNNHSASIEAGNNINLDVNTINNINIHYEIQHGVVTGEEDIYDVQLDGRSKRYNAKEYKIKHGTIVDPDVSSIAGYDIFYRRADWDGEDEDYHIITPDDSSSSWHEYDYHRVIKDDVIKETKPAKIQAGGNIKITADEVTNDKSEITAGNDLTVETDILENIDGKGTRVITDTGRAGAFYTADAGGQWDHYMTTEEHWGAYNKEARTEIIVQPASALVKTEKAKETQDDVKETFTVSNSRLYTSAQPEASYYIETDPAFTDKKQWLSSDYFFEKMQYDPDKLCKKISDGYYEQQIVKDQIINLTGKYYLEGYDSMEKQYKALLDNAVKYAQENDVKIGVALTKEQQETLKAPMVWMVEKAVLLPNGEVVSALVPELYLPKDTDKKQGTAVISAKNIDIKTTNDILNSGNIIAGDTAKLSAQNINNIGGKIQGSDVLLNAQNDVNNTGGSFIAKDELEIKAGNDIKFESTTRTGTTEQGSTTIISSTSGAYVTGENGKLNLEAKNDISLNAAEIASTGSAELTAGHDINLGTKEVSDSNHIVFDSNAYRNDRMEKEVGTTVAAKDIKLNAGNDINAKAAEINAEEKLEVKAESDINITAGKENSFVEEWHKTTWHGIASSKTTTHHTVKDEQTAVESSFGGKEINIEAGKEINVEGSSVVGTKDVSLNANDNINIQSALETRKEITEHTVEKSGILSSGIGFTIGTKTIEDDTDSIQKSRHESTIGSTEGSVSITSGKDVNVSASDIIAKENINLTGENVNIKAENENYDYTHTHREEQTGLTVSLGGGALGQVMENIVQPVERAIEAKDERLKALSAIKAGSHIHEISKAAEQVEKGNLSVANVNIGIGTSRSETVVESSTVTAHESTVAAEKDVNISATGKDINIQGSEVKGENVTLNAKEDINITAVVQGNVTNTETTNSSGFAGVSLGIGTGTFGVNVSASHGKDTIDENSTSYKASSVTAKEKLEIESGKDTNLIGSKAEGEKVEANVGGDLNIESLQETNKYREESVSGGFGINTLLGENISRDISVSANVGKTNSDYKSVTEQAGIYAGKEGFDIKVENNTDLKGAVIASEAEADKNTLTTGTISFSDIKNEAEYDTKGIGMTLDANKTSGNQPSTVGQKGLIPTVPASVGDSAESTTKSGVSEGKINVTKPEKQKQDVSTLNRDTKNTLNKLDQIFDIEKIREDQETAALFGELAANGIHVLAEKNKWKNDDPEKIALHAAVGAVIASITKGNIPAGALAGGATEYLANEIIKACKGDKAQAQWVAMIIGAALSKATGGSAQQGAFVAVNAIRNNFMCYTDDEKDEIREQLYGVKEELEERGYIVPDDFVDEIMHKIENWEASDAIMGYAEIGLAKGIGMGRGLLFDDSNNSYITDDASKGLSGPVSLELCAIKIIPFGMEPDKLSEKNKRDIFSGASIGFTLYLGVGGGISVPASGDYAGKALVIKIGVGTLQASFGFGTTEGTDSYEERKIEEVPKNREDQMQTLE